MRRELVIKNKETQESVGAWHLTLEPLSIVCSGPEPAMSSMGLSQEHTAVALCACAKQSGVVGELSARSGSASLPRDSIY